ncbi:preprotein translocase subunit SecE [Blochmannia endosymbiont of Colobopsis nipponica]|uniref:preprotein translocase subunit SecE n=1 Tax=Blochmannia endosymbiont of Colobopsis nipponica TaxID=2681987 RepID=UPI001785D8A0|nr:preprotein translocase subunit SecE [Blochmannia endosymbiont of Colobopsis nipponica]QOI10913.1 preprotein translocase subunit SecE [Blochmannia endosymbiont of Colobopsis nipponica]
MNKYRNFRKMLYLKIISWSSVLSLFILVLLCNYFFINFVSLLVVLDILYIIVFFIFFFQRTAKGLEFISFVRAAKMELDKVVWPTKRETIQTTLVVAVVTVIVSLLLWGLDSVLVRFISLTLRL